MAYFGNNPVSASYLTDYFSGNNTTVAFTLSRAPVSASSVIITISGVKQAASTYGVSGTTLTFSAAPPSGTNNIEVLHLGVQPDTVVQPSYRTITEFTATAGQTTFSPASYTAGYIDVYRNGVKLGTADFTATNGTSVVLANACAAGDYVRFEGFLITSFNNAIPNTAGAVGSSLIADGTVTDSKLYQVSASKLIGSKTLPSGVLPTGTVLQVVNAFVNGNTYSFTANYNNAFGPSASITPSSASNKILIVATGSAYINAIGESHVDINANGVRISGSGGGDGLCLVYSNTGAMAVPYVITHLHSPATTSAVTYAVVGHHISGTKTTNNGFRSSDLSQIFLLEIAA